MKGKSNVVSAFEEIFQLPVLGLLTAIFFFVTGYFLNEQGIQDDHLGREEVFLSSSTMYGSIFYFVSGAFLLISLFSHAREFIVRKRDSFVETGRALAFLEDLSWKEFADYIIDLYERLGYTLEGASGVRAEGADLKVKREGRISMVRCKKYYVRKVSLSMVAEFYDEICTGSALEKGYFITTGFFSREARRFSAGKPLELVDGVRLMDFARIADSVKSARALAPQGSALRRSDYSCPMCGSPMVLRTIINNDSSIGQFWGCSSFPACKGALRKEREETENFG